ncbi:class I SAM-dependent methyltransferase [Candidatus Uhrbacteria bacterium]|nr:class I SAM-dependent methyltransferase [Candidatus Uhrbacteria bacterium]
MGEKIGKTVGFDPLQYSLLDSGDFEKLERFGGLVLARPEPLAIWKKNDPAAFRRADITYVPGGRDGKEGEWRVSRNPLPDWRLNCGKAVFRLRLTAFKHVGVFPEQSANWDWLRTNLNSGMRVLNLFGYTGGATLAAAAAGAEVTHVDSSRPAVEWARENARLSGLSEARIRWLVDDAVKFTAREIRRGSRYDAILLDPPAFGRGPKGEIWRFEDDLPPLIDRVSGLLPKRGGRLLLNAYSLGFPVRAMEQLVRTSLPFPADIESVELGLGEDTPRGFVLPAGIAVRAKW